MLVIISDLHLTDGTSGSTISPGAFDLFAGELRDMAEAASWRVGGRYRPVERVDLLLLGDVLDVIRSTRWAETKVRPWDDAQNPELIEMVTDITREILRNNATSLATLKYLTDPTQFTVPPADNAGRPAHDAKGYPVPVAIHYLVGNHDWFFHLRGPAYNTLRNEVVQAIGLSNRADAPFPHDPAESDEVLEILRRHKVLARHGDIFDPFNFEGDRDASSLGDVIVIELLNRFAVEVDNRLGDDLPPSTLMGLRELDNVRPLLLVPVWIDGLLERTCPVPQLRKEVKAIWDELAEEFLAQPFVRSRDSWNPNDLVDNLERALKFSKSLSIGWAAKIVSWLQELRGQSESSFYPHALTEQDFRNRRAKYVVYGHTHGVEAVPLDASHSEGYVLNQMYFNSGTWRRTLRQTVLAPNEHEFIPADVMSYLSFFQGDERGGRPYETWSGTLGVAPAEVPLLRVDPGRPTLARGPHVSPSGLHAFAAQHAILPRTGRIIPTRRVR